MESATISSLTIGSVFAARYRVEQRIAAGGMGAVYEVVHIETNRRRALKVMHAHYVSSDELRARFRQEARVAAEIDSEHIVDVFDAGIDEDTGMPFLVMELLRGEDLGKRIKRLGALPKEDVVRYLYETSLALDQTHQARIVHRDLKPDNLFLSERTRGSARIKVLDFGIAKIVKEADSHAQATRALGTPLYMAPEQFRLEGALSGATDIFALGMIAFTALVGKPYWHKESKIAREVLAFALHASRGPTESAVARARDSYGVELPKTFDAWFNRATARIPTDRFATAGEAVRALALALDVPCPEQEPATTKLENAAPAAKPGEIDAEPSTLVLPNAAAAPEAGATYVEPTHMAMTARPRESKDVTPPLPIPRSTKAVIWVAATFLLLGVGAWLVLKTPSKTARSSAETTANTASMAPPLQQAASSEVKQAVIEAASSSLSAIGSPSLVSASAAPEAASSMKFPAPDKLGNKPSPSRATKKQPKPSQLDWGKDD